VDKKQGQLASNWAYGLFIAAGLLCPLCQSSKKRRIDLLVTAETLLICTLLVQGLKRVIPEKRPDAQSHDSFPSGHTTNTIAVAAVQGALDPDHAPLWWTGTALVTLSRLVLRRHRLRDVVAGGLLGYITARIELARRRDMLSPDWKK
jgi:membrane-associated phospholipid phosphatase